MDIQQKRQALDNLAAPRLLITGNPEHGFITSELVEVANKGILSSTAFSAPSAEELAEKLWTELVDDLPDGAHVRVTILLTGDSKRVCWDGSKWHELTEIEVQRYKTGRS